MKKLNLLIAALHAGALALVAGPGLARAQDTAEVRAYMNALSAGTAEAMSQFLELYPNSALPGSEIGASIAGGVSEPTGAIKEDSGASTPADHGFRSNDGDHGRTIQQTDDHGIY
jgi:hypothetical protein